MPQDLALANALNDDVTCFENVVNGWFALMQTTTALALELATLPLAILTDCAVEVTFEVELSFAVGMTSRA